MSNPWGGRRSAGNRSSGPPRAAAPASASLQHQAQDAPDEPVKPTNAPRTVRLDGLALLRIISHCTETLPELCSGSLLGLDVDDTLQVTNSFPFPSHTITSNDPDYDGTEYQMEMMKLLRDVNVDNNCVGWYRSTYMGSFCTADLVEQQFNYQDELDHKAVVLIYDPFQTKRGRLAIRAYRLSDAFMHRYRKYKVAQSADALDLSAEGILDEVKIEVHNSTLQHVLLNDLRETVEDDFDADFDRLDLSSNPYLEKNLESLVEEVDNLASEQHKLQYAERQAQKQLQNRQKWLAQRRADNQARAERGEATLPEEGDPSNPLFQPIPMPSKLESLLIRNQIGVYTKQINEFSGAAFEKMYLAGALQK